MNNFICYEEFPPDNNSALFFDLEVPAPPPPSPSMDDYDHHQAIDLLIDEMFPDLDKRLETDDINLIEEAIIAHEIKLEQVLYPTVTDLNKIPSALFDRLKDIITHVFKYGFSLDLDGCESIRQLLVRTSVVVWCNLIGNGRFFSNAASDEITEQFSREQMTLLDLNTFAGIGLVLSYFEEDLIYITNDPFTGVMQTVHAWSWQNLASCWSYWVRQHGKDSLMEDLTTCTPYDTLQLSGLAVEIFRAHRMRLFFNQTSPSDFRQVCWRCDNMKNDQDYPALRYEDILYPGLCILKCGKCGAYH